MRRQHGYVLLNVGGLAIGITSFIFITLYVIHELKELPVKESQPYTG